MDPNSSGPALSSDGNPVWETLYPWQTGYKKLEQSATQEPEPPLPPMSRELMPFGQRICELRRARGWTQRQVASAGEAICTKRGSEGDADESQG